MAIKTKRNDKFVLIYLYDPVPLDKIGIDRIRNEKLFELITIAEENTILFANPIKKTEVSIQLIRLEYTDTTDLEFDKRSLEIHEKMLSLLPPLRIRAIGVNFFYTLTRDEDILAGEFIRDMFLKEKDVLQEILGKQILGNSTRIFYGEYDDHFDIRISPVDLKRKDIGVILHRHKDVDIADQGRLVKTTNDLLLESCQENVKILNKLF